MNAFKHGLAALQKRREETITTEQEENVRQQILDGLIADKGGEEQVSTATRILAEVIASDATWPMVFNGAIDHIIQNNPKARQNPRGLSQLDGYKRGLVNSLTGNLQKFGLDRVAKVETLEEIFSEADETSENSTHDCPETMNQPELKSCVCALPLIRAHDRKAGASEPETLFSQLQRPALEDNHPFFLNPAMPGERLFVPECL
jgi:hypothetical protein